MRSIQLIDKNDISAARYSALQKDLAITTAQFDAMVSHVIDIENVKTELKNSK